MAVRADLAPGPQLAQSVHAAFEFAVAHPGITADWRHSSNFLVVVQVPDELALAQLAGDATATGLARIIVREPDYGDTITAVAIEPGSAARRLCASFPLALREPAMT